MIGILLEWFPSNPFLVAFISILLSIMVAVAGVLPSTFITIGTVGILGFELGLIILIIGEASGAIISFILYRKGIQRLSSYPRFNKIGNRLLHRLRNTGETEAFFLVIGLRVLPFIPSGAVTLTAALSKIGLLTFSIASTIGKIPALMIEAYTVTYVLELKTELQVGLVILVIVIFLFYYLLKKA